MALCENMNALDEHTKQVTESTGAAKNMMESAYNNSLDAKLNDLSRTFENMYKNILSSDGMKTAVSGLTWVIEKFGNLKTVIAMVTTAFLVMKGKAITGFIADLASVVAGESALSVATVGLTSVFNALNVKNGTIKYIDIYIKLIIIHLTINFLSLTKSLYPREYSLHFDDHFSFLFSLSLINLNLSIKKYPIFLAILVFKQENIATKSETIVIITPSIVQYKINPLGITLNI